MSTPEGNLDGDRFHLLYELGCAFAARLELDELVPLVLDRCREILRAAGASMLLVDPDTGELYFPYVGDRDSDAAARLSTLRFPAGHGIGGLVVRTGRALRLDHAAKDPRFLHTADE